LRDRIARILLSSASKLNRCLNAIGIGKTKYARRLKTRLKNPLRKIPFQIRIDSFRLYVYGNSLEFRAYSSGTYEPHTINLFKETVKRGDTVLDIGAQFGLFSIIAAEKTTEQGKVYAFELIPANFELLTRNIEINGYSNIIRPVQKAVSDKPGTAAFFIYRDTDSHSMYLHPKIKQKARMKVSSISIDQFLAGHPVDVIKMDIEGNEPRALEGMVQTILGSNDLTMFLELHPTYLDAAGVRPEDFVAQIESLGFHIWVIEERPWCIKALTKSVLKDFLSTCTPYSCMNLYCTKGVRGEQVILKDLTGGI